MTTSVDTILIVDARRDERLLYQRLLQNHGLRVLDAASLDEGASILRTVKVSLIVLDVFLSRDDFARSIGTLKRLAGASTPILVVAAWMPTDVAGMAMRVGCSLISKPMDAERVIGAIRQLLAESREQTTPVPQLDSAQT